MKIKVYPLESPIDRDRLQQVLITLLPRVFSFRSGACMMELGPEDIAVQVKDLLPVWELKYNGATVAVDFHVYSDWEQVCARDRKSIAEAALGQLFPGERFELNLTVSHMTPISSDTDALEALEVLVSETVRNMDILLAARAALSSSRLQGMLN